MVTAAAAEFRSTVMIALSYSGGYYIRHTLGVMTMVSILLFLIVLLTFRCGSG